MARKKRIVFSLLGTTLDARFGNKRWERWRPTVALAQHDDLPIDTLELLHGSESQQLANTVSADIAQVSPSTRIVRHVVNFADPWDFEEVYGSLHDLARSYPFDPETNDYLVHITTGSHVAQICLFLLTESRHFPARLLQTSPGRTGAPSPGTYAIIDLNLSRYDGLAARFRKERATGQSFLKAGIETRNLAFNTLIERIEHVAVRSRAPILLTGPTGAGKSRLARRIYELKKARRQITGEFAEVNCATLRGDAAMSALFGHTKGAFTGALSDRSGFLRKAHQGVLFLDEIGELGLDEQAMLLRAIEEKSFCPMGSDREVSSDFQLFAGTNRDLEARIAQGAFRDDLFARINLWTFRLPALSERTEDIPPNLDFALGHVSNALGTNVTMNHEARGCFLEFASTWAWPGNFRDFDASVTRMATLADAGRITERVVKDEVARLRSGAKGGSSHGIGESHPDAIVVNVLGAERARQLDRFDRVQLADVLLVCRNSRSLSEAGRELFANSRAERTSVNDADRLRKYLARFDVTFADVARRRE